MHHSLLLILILVMVGLLLVMVAQRIKVAYPIFLVIAGLLLSLIPAVPRLHLEPDIVFLIFLPPMLYEAAWYTSWNDFWKWRRPIALLAFGLVIFTSTVVAYSSSILIPNFTLALGFLLGGIVSPPDAIAAATVLKGMHVPKRLLTILEGESLINDASSLIVFKFALAAVITGHFSMTEAVGQFFLVAGMGIIMGLVGGFVFYCIHRYLPTIPTIDAAMTVITPYVIFLLAEQFHFSGVMAVVTCGLYMSWRAHEIFDNGQTRVYLFGVWNTIVFVMNTLVFVIIGLELPEVISDLGPYTIGQGIYFGLIICGIIIALRFLWVYPAAYIPRLLSAKVRREPNPGWKALLVLSWAGMRGVVSLATALSIPLTLKNGQDFPERSLIIFITYVVIFVTLVIQGLTLPLIIKLIQLEEIDDIQSEEIQQAGIQLRLDRVALSVLNNEFSDEADTNQLLECWRASLENEIETKQRRLIALDCEQSEQNNVSTYHRILLTTYSMQRRELVQIRNERLFSDEELRKAEMQIDLDELKITGIAR